MADDRIGVASIEVPDFFPQEDSPTRGEQRSRGTIRETRIGAMRLTRPRAAKRTAQRTRASTAGHGRIFLFVEVFARGRRGIFDVGADGSRLELVDSHAAAQEKT